MKKRIEILITPILLVILWIVFSKKINPLFLPRPENVINDFLIMGKNGMLLSSAAISFIRITIATLISFSLALPLSLAIVNYKTLNIIVTPITNVMRYIPVTVFYPLLIMWLGIDESMKIVFLICSTFFYFLPSTILSLKEIDIRLIETAYTMGLNKLQVMIRVMLPAALPTICENFLMMYGIGWTYVVVAEMINTNQGLGHLINIASARGRTDLVFMAVFTIVFISWLFDKAGRKIVRKIFAWKYLQQIEE